MRYTAANLSLGIVQMDKGIELLEDQIALTEQSVKIAELQQKLGMNISTDVEKQQAADVYKRQTLYFFTTSFASISAKKFPPLFSRKLLLHPAGSYFTAKTIIIMRILTV